MKNLLLPLLSAALPFLACTALAAPARPLRTVPHVDLVRYMGDWRVIANVPYFAEKGCVDSIESYRLRPDGKIANTFTYRKRSFSQPQKQIHAVATVYDHQTNAEWRVRFFGIVAASYFITDLDPGYQWAVVAHPSRKYGWVLARTRTLPDHTYRAILGRLKAQGYDPAQFKKVPQLPGQPLPG
jgi:apolipoprotein D and lipocalin family protein